jgi:hypothetical protein
MSVRTLAWWVASFAALGLLVAVVALDRGPSGATASVLGRGALGWRGLARVLEDRGIDPILLDRPLQHSEPLLAAPGGGGGAATLFVGFPWQRAGLAWDPAPVLQFVRRGGRLVLGTSGGVLPGPHEQSLLDSLGAEWLPFDRTRTLEPMRWWRNRRSVQTWEPGADAPWDQPLTIGPVGAAAVPPRAAGAAVLAVEDDGEPRVTVFRVGRGEVWLLPSQVFANAYLGEPGNAALALALCSRIGQGPVVIDEYHHGLVGSDSRSGEPARAAFDAVLLHLGALWVLAVVATAWRFGPAWPAPVAVADAHRAYLLGLGALHHRLGHDRDAARAMVRRVAAYDPLLLPPDRLESALERAETLPLDELARELSRPAARPGRVRRGASR